VALLRYEDDFGILVPDPDRDLGAKHAAQVPLPMGTYLRILRMPGFADVRYPVHITRNRRWIGRVKLRTREEIGDGFVLVPGGPFVYGEGRDTKPVELPDFIIASTPVTFAEWAVFVSAIEMSAGLEAATKLCPGTPGERPLMERSAEGEWQMKADDASGPLAAALLARHGAGFKMRMPVFGVSWHDAVAYCEWKTKATGKRWRLPTEEEREKAARGVDGRMFRGAIVRTQVCASAPTHGTSQRSPNRWARSQRRRRCTACSTPQGASGTGQVRSSTRGNGPPSTASSAAGHGSAP
jgi:serine/threonine-protein kinase